MPEPLNRELAEAIISQAAACDRDCLDHSGRYSAEEIRAAISKVLDEVNQDREPRH